MQGDLTAETIVLSNDPEYKCESRRDGKDERLIDPIVPVDHFSFLIKRYERMPPYTFFSVKKGHSPKGE
jgi:hypothetical protein